MSLQTADVDVLLYVERKLHLPFLEPIHDYFRRRYPELRVAFSAPEFHAPSLENPGWGLKEATVRRLCKKSRFIARDESVRPRVTVVADVCHYNLPWQSKVVNVGHGLICKGMYYRRDPVVRRENLSDLVCVPDPWHKRRLEDNVFVPIRVTGFIKSDQLFGPKAEGRESFCSRHDVDPQNNIILFAPTFNPELSSIPYVRERITELGDDSSLVCVKLHQMTPKPWQEMYESLAEERDDVFMLDDTDYSGMMHAADVMVSDVSSMYAESMLLNKPVVLFNNPQRESVDWFDPDDIEYKVRDAALEAETFGQLRRKVDKILERPDILEEKREQYIEELDYGRDGRSAQRAGEAVRELLIRPRRTWARPRFSVILHLGGITRAGDQQSSIEEIVRKSGDASMELLVVEGKVVGAGGDELHEQLPAQQDIKLSLEEFYKACSQARGERVVLVKAGWVLPMNWLKWLDNHFRWNRRTGMVKAMADPGQSRRAFELLFPGLAYKSDPDDLAWDFLHIGIGSGFVNDRKPSPCVMAPPSVLQAVLNTFSEQQALMKDLSEGMEEALISSGYASVTSMETFVYSRAMDLLVQANSLM